METIAQNKKFRLRVMYEKTQEVSWLSHLEVARALEKTIRRSGLDFCVSQGFSPHMKISFGRALNVGVDCCNEIFDLYLKTYIPADKAFELLRSSQCRNLPILKCWYVENSSPAASTTYIGADYVVVLDTYNVDKNSISVPKQILQEKPKKNKIIDVSKFLDGEPNIDNDKLQKNKTKIRFSLRVVNGASIKPELFLKALFDKIPATAPKISEIHKKNIFNFPEHKF